MKTRIKYIEQAKSKCSVSFPSSQNVPRFNPENSNTRVVYRFLPIKYICKISNKIKSSYLCHKTNNV